MWTASAEEAESENDGFIRSRLTLVCVETYTSQKCAELFSLSSYPNSGRKRFLVFKLTNAPSFSSISSFCGVTLVAMSNEKKTEDFTKSSGQTLRRLAAEHA